MYLSVMLPDTIYVSVYSAADLFPVINGPKYLKYLPSSNVFCFE